MKSEFDSLCKNIEHLKKASDFITLISEIDIIKYINLAFVEDRIELDNITIINNRGCLDESVAIEIRSNLHRHELFIYQFQIDLYVVGGECNYYYLNLDDIVSLYKLNKNPGLLNFM